MFKKIYLFFVIVLFIQYFAIAQIPAGYYNTASGLSGAPLKTALYNIIKGHTDMGYNGLYACYTTTDNLPGNKVFDIYSVRADSTANYWFINSADNADQCGNYSAEGDCYNREHSFPQSWFNESSPMKADLFHIYPTDGKVNGMRSNYPYGTVSSPTFTSTNGSKLGSCSFPGYNSTVFEPIDVYKGDIARTYFYMATRYENLIAGWVNNGTANEILAGNTYPVFKTWVINLMIQWNNQDPVSQKEIIRNNAIYSYQHNRNPYIDHPEYVAAIWGGGVNILVTSVAVNAQGGSNTISTPGGTLQMNATVLPSNATNNTVSWSVKNPNIGTISSTGLLTALSNGIDTIVATANDGSGKYGFKVITISNQGTGINFFSQYGNILVYPNPAVNEINIDFSQAQLLPETISISDIRGRVIQHISDIVKIQKVDISGFEKGLYLITLKLDGQQITYKFIK